MSKIIIGIHGLGNKPPQEQLARWWKSAILEGLEGLQGHQNLRFVKFELVYWASVLHAQPYELQSLNEPYIRGEKDDSLTVSKKDKRVFRDKLNEQIDRIFLEKDGALNFSHLTDFILKHFIKDLDSYYRDNDGRIRDQICGKLAEALLKNKRKKIMLIAHSMGSIIAWDVLTKWVPDIKIDTLVTIGSPLGNPVVRGRMLSERLGSDKIPLLLSTPENITGNWYNLADYKDKVAMSYDLKSDFMPNSLGVQPEDNLVWNNYEYKDEINPHKSYGYLRCSEMAEIISSFSKSKFGLFRL